MPINEKEDTKDIKDRRFASPFLQRKISSEQQVLFIDFDKLSLPSDRGIKVQDESQHSSQLARRINQSEKAQAIGSSLMRCID